MTCAIFSLATAFKRFHSSQSFVTISTSAFSEAITLRLNRETVMVIIIGGVAASSTLIFLGWLALALIFTGPENSITIGEKARRRK